MPNRIPLLFFSLGFFFANPFSTFSQDWPDAESVDRQQLVAAKITAQSKDQQSTSKTGIALIIEQAESLKPLIKSNLARTFLESATQLPKIEARDVLCDPNDSRNAVSVAAAKKFQPEELAKYEPRQLDETFYYFTRYGSPLAFVRPLEIAATKTGIENVAGKRIVDFGFGTIGHLRMLAAQGADVTGIEVDRLLQALYSEPSDVGKIANASKTSTSNDGNLELLFGSFPAQLNGQVRDKVDLFISKNTLKRGYIHPEKPVDPKKLVHLGVSDERFLQSVYAKLKPDGLFLIYNLHPAPAAEGEAYIPWADGRSPFSRKAFQNAGFKILEFDADDTTAARLMAKALKWDEQMDLKNDLFATYTLVKKTP